MTVYQGNSEESWKTIAWAGLSPSGCRTSMEPPVDGNRPLTIFRNVDLPQPDGPTMLTNSPSRISMSTPSTARSRSPDCLSTYSIFTPRASSARPCFMPLPPLERRRRTPLLVSLLKSADQLDADDSRDGEDENS